MTSAAVSSTSICRSLSVDADAKTAAISPADPADVIDLVRTRRAGCRRPAQLARYRCRGSRASAAMPEGTGRTRLESTAAGRSAPVVTSSRIRRTGGMKTQLIRDRGARCRARRWSRQAARCRRPSPRAASRSSRSQPASAQRCAVAMCDAGGVQTIAAAGCHCSASSMLANTRPPIAAARVSRRA